MKHGLLRWLLLWLAALQLVIAAREAGLRLNTSASVPRGLYRLSSARPQRGGYVAVCPPRAKFFEVARDRGYIGRGRCPGGTAALIKVFAAGPGDHVRIDERGVQVGTRLWPSSAPRKADAAGRPLVASALATTLPRGRVLVMSEDCRDGFDSRYFGPLPSTAVVGTAVPLLTW